MSAPRRADRVSREIQRELSQLIRREVRDPRVREVTVTRAEVSDDLREARVYWVPLGQVQGEERIEELSSGLKAAAAFLQHRVGQELKLRFTPRLRFTFDKGIENLVRVHDLLEGITRDGSEE